MSRLAEGRAGDTIFAQASGGGRAAITVLRLSGPEAGPLLAGLAGKLPAPRRASLRSLHDRTGAPLDRALVLWMPGPASYTGEDSAELHLHGGHAVAEAVIGALLQAGARPADAGEFTRRAFLAGRMDLLEAEAVGDLINSDTQSQRIQALAALGGGPTRLVAAWTARVTRCLAIQEALIDFPDDTADAAEIPPIADIAVLISEIDEHLRAAPAAQRLRTGLVFAICGPPNAGKSSLFNALAQRDLAIVDATPGTTRDVLEATLEWGGVAVTLVDTAGIRQSDDPVEAEGVRRAMARAASADLVLCVSEGGAAPNQHLGPAPTMHIASKADLFPAATHARPISVRTGAGLDDLRETLAQAAAQLTHADGGPLLWRARHVSALQDARRALSAALGCQWPELRAEELRLALLALGRLTGRVDTEAVLDVVFGAFCIGK